MTTSEVHETVVILGASEKPDRFAYKAFKKLQRYGHKAIPVRPGLKELEGQTAYDQLSDIKVPVHTLTMYIGAANSSPLQKEILALHPKRVIFNPGSENPTLARALHEADIEVVEACTLILLDTDRF